MNNMENAFKPKSDFMKKFAEDNGMEYVDLKMSNEEISYSDMQPIVISSQAGDTKTGTKDTVKNFQHFAELMADDAKFYNLHNDMKEISFQHIMSRTVFEIADMISTRILYFEK
jgi:hypothetical protein